MQCVLIKRMVEDLNLPPEVVVCPTSESVAPKCCWRWPRASAGGAR